MAAEVAEAYFDFKFSHNQKPPPTSLTEPEPKLNKKVETASRTPTETSNNADINSIISGGDSGYGRQTGAMYGSGNSLSGSGQSASGINSILSGGSDETSTYNRSKIASIAKPDDQTLESGESNLPAYDEHTMFSRKMPDYKIGADIFRNKGQALRYLDNPAKGGRSINHAKDYKKGMDIHNSSGIFNLAFYL